MGNSSSMGFNRDIVFRAMVGAGILLLEPPAGNVVPLGRFVFIVSAVVHLARRKVADALVKDARHQRFQS